MNLPVPVAPAALASAQLIVYSPAFEEALASAKAFAGASRAERTVEAYRGAFDAFCRWCLASGIAQPFPASIEATVAYLAHLAGTGRKASTVDLHVAAIACAHRSAGYEPPTNSEAVKATVKGIRRRIGTKVTRKAPATAEALKKMLKRIPDTLIGKRDRALLLIGFAAALRRSELVALWVSDVERTPEGVIIHIPRSKTPEENARHVEACADCARQRGAVALHPAASFADVLLKVRVFVAGTSVEDDAADLAREIGWRGGQAYDDDVAHAVVLDLARLAPSLTGSEIVS